jgi:L-rhamnose mutarotase/Right handed beta helix region
LLFRSIIICCVILLSAPDAGSQIYVSAKGSDINEGSKERPLASVAMAMRKVRELRRLNDPFVAGDVHIYIENGLYQFTEPLFIRPEDAGSANSRTIIEAVPGAKPVFSGGMKLKGWTKIKSTVPGVSKKAQDKLWVTDAPVIGDRVLDFRQLWVNDRKAVRARDKNPDSMYRILSWNKKTEQCWIPKPSTAVSNVEGLEMVIHQWWAIAVLRIKSVAVKGDSALLSFHQPESRIQSEHPWPAPWISAETGNSAFYLTNAIQFLDSPGEWYLDKKNRKIYYWPNSDENLSTAAVVVPVLETLVKIQGSKEQPVSKIWFKNISFQHTSWLRPSQQGHVPLQTGMFLLDAYKLKVPGTPDKKTLENQAWVGRPAAAIEIVNANNINFESCRFEHLASTALDFNKGTQNSTINGNLFKDIGGTAILAGVFSDESTEAHLPYKPSDEREICSDLTISNNLINDAANEDWGCVGIGAGFVKNIRIEHNDLSDLPYTGISLGWGWTKTENAMKSNKVIANKITRYGRQLYDVAAIYTLSAQPGTEISENYIDSIYKARYAHIPSHWFYLYTDEGSSGITVKNNWTPSEKYLQNANGPGNFWANNGPTVSRKIKEAAGLEPHHRYLLSEKDAYNKNFPINHEQPVIIELVSATNQSIDIGKLKQVLVENKIDPNTVYQWNNHTAVFARVEDAFVLKNRLQKEFPNAQARIYYDSFYEFNRKHCTDTTSSGEWEHILLTANLVANTKKQQEYLDYHAAQFQKWPEVSKGFCNASFQQLLIYRNGRQLMLVISIPKGESLNKLNPKTTENNPRVDEWNKLMKNYQEGIEGTKPGETWVFLKKL